MSLDHIGKPTAAPSAQAEAGDSAPHGRWAQGDVLGLRIPADPETLRAAGAAFLTEAFRAAGVLGADNSVTAVTRFEDCPGGSTGLRGRLCRCARPGVVGRLSLSRLQDPHDYLTNGHVRTR